MKKQALAAAVAAALSAPAYADPPPAPNLNLPSVFCFRITDVERTLDNADQVIEDSFLFEIEVLNWTNRPASGLHLALNEGTSDGVIVGDASIDSDGRGGSTGTSAAEAAYGEIGAGIADAVPVHNGRGTALDPNDWRVLNQSDTSVFFDAQVDFEPCMDCGYGGDGGFFFEEPVVNGTEIPFQDLVGGSGRVPGTGTDGTGDSAVDGGPAPFDNSGQPANPLVNGAPVSAQGEGNSLDGFVVQIDNLGEGDTVSFNWQLLQATGFFGEFLDLRTLSLQGPGSGDPMSCSDDPTACFDPIRRFNGNLDAFGFGTLSIARMGITNGDPDAPPAPLFVGNTGFNQNPATFFGDVFSLKNRAEVSAEIGGGQVAQYQNPLDNLFGQTVNTQLAAAVPEPTSLALLGLGLGLAGWRRSRRF